jgi:hypothetical protein
VPLSVAINAFAYAHRTEGKRTFCMHPCLPGRQRGGLLAQLGGVLRGVQARVLRLVGASPGPDAIEW